MSKLVDRERLAKLAKALDQRMKAAVNAEEQRALAAEAKALEDAIKAAEEKDAVLASRIQALEGLVVGGEGEGLEAVIGDVAQNKADIAELKEFKDAHSHEEMEAGIQAADEKAQAAKDAINAFMSAEAIKEGAIDTLKEIQEYIESDGAAAEEMVANISAAQKAADDEKVRAEAEEAKIREEFAAADVALKAEMEEAMAEAVAGVHAHENKEVLDGINAEKVTAWDEAQAGAEAKAAELDAALKLELQAEIDADVKAVADDLALEKAKIVELQTFVEGHKDFDASELEGKVQALEEFQAGHDHTQMETDIEELQEAMANKVEQGAIDAAVEGLMSEEEVKAMLGNVVSSLALMMEDNKMVLKLGGVDGIELHSAELDMASDADIDEIIAGLDDEE